MSDLLPPNATPLERAISRVGSRVEDVPVPIATLWNPDACPAALLPWLAWAESVDDWFTTWTEAQKRGAIKASFGVHARKGTAGALRLAIQGIGLDVVVTEWFQKTPMGAPYTFSCAFVVDQQGIASAEAFDRVVAVSNSTKNLRSHMTGVDIQAVTRATEYVGAVVYLGERVSIAAEPA
jgi:phage tail P2-like protein